MSGANQRETCFVEILIYKLGINLYAIISMRHLSTFPVTRLKYAILLHEIPGVTSCSKIEIRLA